jgi:hypothetical protein
MADRGARLGEIDHSDTPAEVAFMDLNLATVDTWYLVDPLGNGQGRNPFRDIRRPPA